MDGDAHTPSAGRPKDMEKRSAILDAARMLFFLRGVEQVTIEAIAAASGVSKVTVYSHFGDKVSIFTEVVRREVDRMSEGIAHLEQEGGSLEDKLVHFGQQLLTFLTHKEISGLDHLLAAEAQRHPALAQAFFESGPGRVRSMLAELLEEAGRRGHLRIDNPLLAAEQLIALWQGMMMIELRFGTRKDVPPDEITDRVRQGVAVLFAAYRAPTAI